jgi:hypothetical protein
MEEDTSYARLIENSCSGPDRLPRLFDYSAVDPIRNDDRSKELLNGYVSP